MVRNLVAVLVAALVVFPATPADAAGKDVVTAAWVYVGPVGDAGWTFGHDLGRRGVAAESPWLRTEFVESVSEADAERVIETYARKGVDVIFTTSFGFSDPTIKVAKKYPKTIFMHCSGFKRADNVGTYFGRMEQAKFLAGIAAGLVTGSAKIGYVAPMPIPEVVRFVNAFTLGVRQVKPEAMVKVVWTGDWFLPTVEKQAADSLMDAGCDVIATGCDSSAPLAAAEARRTWAVGYDSDAHQYALQHWLTAPIWDWTILYRQILGKVREGGFKKADLVLAKVDVERRLAVARNHTATHLLQAALRQILGRHVQQQGSLVREDYLRFDFSHFKALSDEEISRIEELVNGHILAGYSLLTKEMPLASARKTGALAFFAEKYAGKVRVVSIADFSRELCGGTHLDSTSQIGLFKITHEGSVASGIRRIEAVTGAAAFKLAKQEGDILKEIAALLNIPKEKIAAELEKRLAHVKELEKQLNSKKLSAVRSSVDDFIKAAETIGDIKLITRVIPDADMAALRSAVDLIKQKTSGAVVALASTASGRALLVVGVTADLAAKGIDALVLTGKTAALIGGSGGGRKDFAQAGGNNPAGIDAALAELKNIISQVKI